MSTTQQEVTVSNNMPPHIRPAHWSTDHLFQIALHLHRNSGARVVRQHVVSKTVLRNYTLGGTSAPRITAVDLTDLTARDVGIADAGIAKNFIRVDSANAEEVWGRTETLIPAAVEAARNPTILQQPEHLEVLRRALALHFARAHSTLEILDRTWTALRGRLTETAAAELTHVLVPALERRHGTTPTRQDLVDLVHEAATETDEIVASGAYARVRVEQLYDQALEKLESWHIEVVRVPSNDLVITDNPVVLARVGDDRRTSANRIALAEANSIVFPIAPDVLVSMGPQGGYTTATEQAVADLNRSQIAGARRFVFHRRGQDISNVVTAYTAVR